MGNVEYQWTGGDEFAGLPFPTEKSSPNAARDIKYLAEHIQINADDPNLPTFTSDGPPLHFYGEGRPDAFGWYGTNGSDGKNPNYSKLASAPMGSTFTATTDVASNFGAKVWIHNGKHAPGGGHTNHVWECIEGYYAWYAQDLTFTPGDVNLIRLHRLPNSRVNIAMQFKPSGAWDDSGQPNYFFEISDGFRGPYYTPYAVLHLWSYNKAVGARLPSSIMNDRGLAAYGEIRTADNNNYLHGTYLTHDEWPSSTPVLTPRRSVKEMQDLVSEIENDPDHPDAHLLEDLLEQLAEVVEPEGPNNG